VEEFKERHNDSGRDLVLYLARRATELTVAQLVERKDKKDADMKCTALK
jgi:hypothetical protein